MSSGNWNKINSGRRKEIQSNHSAVTWATSPSNASCGYVLWFIFFPLSKCSCVGNKKLIFSREYFGHVLNNAHCIYCSTVHDACILLLVIKAFSLEVLKRKCFAQFYVPNIFSWFYEPNISQAKKRYGVYFLTVVVILRALRILLVVVLDLRCLAMKVPNVTCLFEGVCSVHGLFVVVAML